MRLSLIVAPPCGSDSSQAPVQRSLILTPNKYRMLTLTFCKFLNVVDDDDDGAVVIFSFLIRPSNVHAYIREVRPEHCREYVQRTANYW